MTPVATPVALRATSWDAALAETLSDAAARAFADGTRRDGCFPDAGLRVHSVHRRVLNIQHDGTLISLAADTLDDAPATIRVPIADWNAHGIRAGTAVAVDAGRLEIATDAGGVEVFLEGATLWTPARAASGTIPMPTLAHALTDLASIPAAAATTPFGRASAEILATGIRRLRSASLARLRAGDEADAAVTAAAARLLGLGEGLTPSGDDVLTGLALVAADPVFGLSALTGSLNAAVAGGADSTTLLSIVTLRAAVAGRGRQRLHDLIAAIAADDRAAVRDAAARTLEIGHSSGHDILTGIRLALELAVTIHPENRSSEGDH